MKLLVLLKELICHKDAFRHSRSGVDTFKFEDLNTNVTYCDFQILLLGNIFDGEIIFINI